MASTDPNGVTRYRVEELDRRLHVLEDKVDAALATAGRVHLLVEQLVESAAENKRSIKGIFISLGVGVALLLVTTVLSRIL